MNEIEIDKIIERWENRVVFLIDWKGQLMDDIKKNSGQKLFEIGDKIYQLETEIESKKMFIDTYEKDQEKRKQQLQQATNQVNEDMGSKIKLLRTKEPDHPAHKEMKKGILNRFAKNKYKTMTEKIHDYNNACELVK